MKKTAVEVRRRAEGKRREMGLWLLEPQLQTWYASDWLI